MKYLVYSDLDGTLLNHDDYCFKDASEALSYLQTKSIPLIIVTSKTFAEVKPLQEKLNIKCPFIVENGAGIFIPSDSVLAQSIPSEEDYIKISQAQSYLELRLFFKHLQLIYSIRGFGDMKVEEVMELTSLSKEDALNAMKRDFTEPFIIENEIEIQGLIDEANKEGLDIVKGGRFYHLISKGQDKAKAMQRLTHLFEEHFSLSLTMIALGDSANDFSMLKAAHKSVLIPGYDGVYADVEAANISKSPFPGPKGWNISLLEILNG
ncbi:MAG: mannosyl-3-phosphoglycerate phosphatase [Sulfurimonas sp.]|jgi:mannosyl-3-phosphoglycerate phosphatase|uniref:HAD-IIB family hydrolase n=1 Tax=Sulfurimonas sp. TaxID=2022749 RepID=UPI0039E42F3A